MKNTRFMEVLFSAVEDNDEELTDQVACDIENAKANGEVDTDELKYESVGNGKVCITDKETGEVTVAEKADDTDDTYDLYPAEMTQQIEGFLHPGMDGVTPGSQVGAQDEYVRNHMMGGGIISPNLPNGGLNFEAGHEQTVEEHAMGEEEKEFSVYSDNAVVSRVFSDQEFCERVFSEVIESEETVKVGDIKVEKLPDEDNAVIVTSESTGDQAKIVLDEDEMEVTELDSKAFSDECCDNQFNALHVVGVDPVNKVIVDAPEYSEESASELVERLQEQGVEAVQVFECPEEARDYAMSLLNNLGVESEDEVEEPEQVEFSDHTVYVTKFYSDTTDYMLRMFSESECDIETSQEAVEDAIENGDQIENETEIITPIDAETAVVEDKETGEFTKVSLDGEDMKLTPISEEEADELTQHLEVEDDEEDEEDEKKFSDIYCDEYETKFFSEHEEMTSYMTRLFSDESDSEKIEDAIENGEEIENETEIITPIDAETAVIEDKETGEFTKAVMDDDDLDISPISEEEAEELLDGIEVSEDEEVEDEEDEKKFSDIYCDEYETKFFSEHEEMTSYMTRLFSDESDSEKIEDAIENGEEIENETEIITPIDAETAVIEDKETGEFTKAVMDDEDLDISPISEEEAKELLDGIEVSEDEEVEDDEEGEKKFSDIYCDEYETKFFSEHEEMTSYMTRLFSDESDSEKIEDAIENGEEIENETEIITPIDAETAVIEDKETGEFTKAVMDDEDLDISPISEEEAKELLDGIEVSEDEEVEDDEEGEKKFSDTLYRFFSETVSPQGNNAQQAPTAEFYVDENGNPTEPVNPEPEQDQNSVEAVEDKALAAVQSIQEAAQQAVDSVMQAKEAPVQNQEGDLKEAQFSYFDYDNDITGNDTLLTWLSGTKL